MQTLTLKLNSNQFESPAFPRKFDADFGNLLILGRQAKDQKIHLVYDGDETNSKVNEQRKIYANYLDARKYRYCKDEDQVNEWWAETGIDDLFPNVEFPIYQKTAILWLLQVRRGGLYYEMGLGKSLITLGFLSKLVSAGEVKKPLIICPLSLISPTAWFGEIQKYTDFEPVSLRAPHTPTRQPIYFVNPELLSARCFESTKRAKSSYIHNNILTKENFDFVMFDESSLLGNPSSLISKVMLNVLPGIPNVVLASGAPSPTNCFQFFVQMKIIGSVLGQSYNNFQEKYGTYRLYNNAKVYTPKTGAVEEIRKIIDPVCYFLQVDGNLELPKRHEVDIHVDMHPDQAALYKQLEEKYIAIVSGHDPDSGEAIEGTVTIKYEAVVRMKLLQVAGGFLISKDEHDEDVVYKLKWSPKFDRFMELVDTIQGNTIIWCRFRYEVERILKLLTDKYGQDSTCYVYGDMTKRQREDQLSKWGDSCRFLISVPQSTRFGFTWLKATNTIFFSATDSFADYTQARSRNFRHGQTKEITEYKLKVKNTVEDAVWTAITTRTKVDQYLKTYFLTKK